MHKAKIRTLENVKYTLRDKNGNIKPLFQENKIARLFRKMGIALPTVRFLTGRLVNEMNLANLITNAGFAGVASRINGAGSEAAFTYVAIGTGTTAADVTDTTLETEIASGGGSRANGTASRVTTDVSNDTAQVQHTFTFSSSFAVTESGILNAGASGVLLARQVFSAINVASGDSLQVTWQFDCD